MSGAKPVLRQTANVVLRRLTADDLAPYQTYRTHPEVARFQTWERQTNDQAHRFLTAMSVLDPILRPGKWGQIAIALAPTNTLIGDLGLFLAGDSAEAEIGITIARPHQRQGYAMKAMHLAMGLVFDTTPVTRIICGADNRNAASQAMIRKLGFVWTHTEPGEADVIDEMFAMERSAFNAP